MRKHTIIKERENNKWTVIMKKKKMIDIVIKHIYNFCCLLLYLEAMQGDYN